jgi:hypothetical protein
VLVSSPEVSGMIVVPPGPTPEDGRPIVAWAHPTTGIIPRCALSLAILHFQQIQGLRNMVERGYIVAATDYRGLGTVGPHPWHQRRACGTRFGAGRARQLRWERPSPIRRVGPFARRPSKPLCRTHLRKLRAGNDVHRGGRSKLADCENAPNNDPLPEVAKPMIPRRET